MRLVGVQGHCVAWLAVTSAMPVVEALNAGQRAADGVSVVAMHRIRLAVKARFDVFHSVDGFGVPHPLERYGCWLATHGRYGIEVPRSPRKREVPIWPALRQSNVAPRRPPKRSAG